MVKVRIRGIDRVTRDMAYMNDKTYEAARTGTVKAANHLMDKIVSKFGSYQKTGGDPNGYGRWKKLKYDTIKRKVRKYGMSSDNPLVASGKTRDSWSVIEGGKNRLAASVVSSSKAIIHHIYGAPRANLPMRDPARITAKEEALKCRDIIQDEINTVIRRG